MKVRPAQITQANLPGAPTTSTNLLWNKSAASESVQRGSATTGSEVSGGTPTVYDATVSVTFPTAFTSTPHVFVNNPTGNYAWGMAQSTSTTGTTLHATSFTTGTASRVLSWLAIGPL